MNLRKTIIENLWNLDAVTTIGRVMIPVLGDPSGDVPVCVVKIAGVQCAVHILSVSNNSAGGTKLLFRSCDPEITDGGDNDIVITDEESIKNKAGEVRITVKCSPIVDEYYMKMGYVSMIHIIITDNRYNITFNSNNRTVQQLLEVYREDKEQCEEFIRTEQLRLNGSPFISRESKMELEMAYRKTGTHEALMAKLADMINDIQKWGPPSPIRLTPQ